MSRCKWLIAIVAVTVGLSVFVWAALIPSKQQASGQWSPEPGFVPSGNELKAVEAVKLYFQKQEDRHDIDYQFKVEMQDGEYWIYVQHIHGYYDSGEPIIIPGSFTSVVVTRKFVVKRVTGGA